MQTTDQINTRVDAALKAELDAIAATLDVPASSLLRETLESSLPALRERANAAIQQRNHFPGNIPVTAIETELLDLLRRIGRTEPLAVMPRDLLGPRGKALHALLCWLFGADPATPEEKSARTKLAKWLDALDIKASVKASAHVAPPTAIGDGTPLPPSKPIKHYPRRGTAGLSQ